MFSSTKKEHNKSTLANGVDINFRNENNLTALFIAIVNGQTDAAKYLLKKGAYLTTWLNDSILPIYTAAEYGRDEIVKAILDQDREQVNVTQSHGLTPLHVASFMGRLQTVKILLEYGAEINAKTQEGATALYYAAQENQKEILQLLLEKGADINSQRSYGYAPLHVSALNGLVDICKILIENGADINIRSHNNSTPLYVATEHNKKETVEVLMENKADINLRGVNDLTVTELAASKPEYAELLPIIEKHADKIKTAP